MSAFVSTKCQIMAMARNKHQKSQHMFRFSRKKKDSSDWFCVCLRFCCCCCCKISSSVSRLKITVFFISFTTFCNWLIHGFIPFWFLEFCQTDRWCFFFFRLYAWLKLVFSCVCYSFWIVCTICSTTLKQQNDHILSEILVMFSVAQEEFISVKWLFLFLLWSVNYLYTL